MVLVRGEAAEIFEKKISVKLVKTLVQPIKFCVLGATFCIWKAPFYRGVNGRSLELS